MIYRVSHIEAFRKWESDEEAEVEDLFAILRGDWPESPAMAAGTAFHKALEVASPGNVEELQALGHRFVFAGDFDLCLTPIRELRATKVYTVDGRPLIVTGQVDGLDGHRVDDHKTTGRFDPDRYLGGFQWRLYLDLFGARHFRWNVFELAEIASEDHLSTYEVRAQHTLEQFRYPALADDCQAIVTRFARFVREHQAAIKEREAA